MTTHYKNPFERIEQPRAVDDEKPLDAEGARISAELISIMNTEPIHSLGKIDTGEYSDNGQTITYAAQHVVGAKLARSYDLESTTISSRDVFTELDAHSLMIKRHATLEFYQMFDGLATLHNLSHDEFAHTFSDHLQTSLQYLAQDTFAYATNKNLIDNSDGSHTNFSSLAQRIRMLEVVMILGEDLNKPGLINDIYATLGKHSTPDGITPLQERQADTYTAEVVKEHTNTRKLRRMRKEYGDDAQTVVDRAAVKLLLGNSHARMRQTAPNQTELRRQYQEAIQAIEGTDISAVYTKYNSLLDRLNEYGAKNKDANPINPVDIIQAAELDWEVLPPGEIREIAEDIITSSQRESTPATIDLDRLKILANVRESWGADKTFYARGTLGKRHTVRDNGQESPDQYLILVLQETDEHGAIIAEHAVAESPIAGRNAMYIFRQDVSEGLSWREVMALPKSYARDLGARPLNHTLPRRNTDLGLIESMTTKAELLLSCTKEEFEVASFDGSRGIRLPRTVLPQVQ